MSNWSVKLDKVNANKIYAGLCLIVAVIISFVYSELITKDPILKRDDVLLILPLKSVTSFAKYIDDVQSNAILDFQPIRDASFLLDIKIIELTDISFFHATNVVIFLGVLFFFMKLLEVLGFSRSQIIGSGFLFAAHPIMVSTVGWISARKHSLALLFLLISLVNYLKHKKITNRVLFFFLASILSHQIFILFPIWVFVYSHVKKSKLERDRFFVLSFLGGIVLFLGVMKTFFLEMGNVTYKYYHWSENISRYALSLGRSITQVFFPISVSSDYFQGNILNLIGLPVLILGLLVFYKGKNKEDTLLWILLAGLSHILTYITFVNDTYLYLPLICVLVSLNYYFANNVRSLNHRFKIVSVVIIIGFLGAKSIGASRMWRSDLDLWKYSYINEPSPFTSFLLGTQLLEHQDHAGLDYLVWGAKNYDLVSSKALLLSFLDIISMSSLPIQEKIRIYSECYKPHNIYKAYFGLALIEGTDKQTDRGISILKSILNEEQTYSRESYGFSVLKKIKKVCQIESGKSRVCHELKISY